MPMKVAASVTMDGGVLDEVLMAPTPYQTHFLPGNAAGTLDFPCFMSPDPVSSPVSSDPVSFDPVSFMAGNGSEPRSLTTSWENRMIRK